MKQDETHGCVLVVDDDDDLRECLVSIVSDVGYVVTAVADGASALDAARKGSFALATLDMRMPGMTGLETLAQLRTIAPEMPVVVISGHVTPAEAEACADLGAFAVVQKPFDLKQLVATLERAESQRGTREIPPGP